MKTRFGCIFGCNCDSWVGDHDPTLSKSHSMKCARAGLSQGPSLRPPRRDQPPNPNDCRTFRFEQDGARVGSCITTCETQRPSRPGSRRLLHVTIGFVGSCKRQPFLSKLQPRISIDRVASPCRSLLAVLGLACETELFCPTSGSSPGMVNTDCG